MTDLNVLNKVFVRYGYEQKDLVEGKYVIYSSGTSMYPAIEIVQLGKSASEAIQEAKKMYAEAGYAVRVCNVDSIEQIESYLFNLFFQVKESNQRNMRRYEEYTRSIMQSYLFQGAGEIKKYEYINIPYSVEYDFKKTESPVNQSVVESIQDNLKKKGSQFIIVEAGAGFGKTSTAYELLNSFKNVTKDILPFFMELYNDRIATTFRYLLLSQIDRTFKVRLGSDIVLYNIKRGKIPLIIDGFDELLSKDLDNGQLEAKFSKVETMLSTIGELLTDEAKVILTTRKTAIFTGENFYDWYLNQMQQGRQFNVIRYQLGTPSIEDWLDKGRVQKLPANFEKISNPVVLGYLRYLSDSDFIDVVESSSLTKSYLNSILKREKERQELPFNVEEQVLILRHLASYFAGFDTNAYSRSEIKNTIYELDSEMIENAASPRQDSKSLSNALTNHAFLDRKGDNSIGFINDFILGTFLMYAIKDESNSFYFDFFESASYSFLEKAILAGSVCDIKTKRDFWSKLWERCHLNTIAGFWADILLKDQPCHSYENVSFDEKPLNGVLIGVKEYPIQKCSFSNIIFKNCMFDFNYVLDCSFINCTFINCSKEGTNLECGFYGCTTPSDDTFIDKEKNEICESSNDDSGNVEMQILAFYFKVDHRTPRMRMISKIKDKFDDSKIFRKKFDELVTKGYVLTNGDKSFISQLGIDFYNQKK